MKNSHERLYRPAETRLLFIGEAAPASGRFFYRRDSGLYRAIRDAFRALDPSMTDERFLAIFEKAGCYLIDACVELKNQPAPANRHRDLIAVHPKQRAARGRMRGMVWVDHRTSRILDAGPAIARCFNVPWCRN
jgi:hypothetical protein